MSQFVEAACINSFHSCNKAPPEVTISDTFSAFVTSMAGIKGRRKWQEPIEHPHIDSTQVNSVDTNVDLQITNAPTLQPATDGVGSAEVSMLLGIPQQTSSVSNTHDVTMDLGSAPYHLQGSQASGLRQMPVDPMSLDSSIDPLNLAFLDVDINHSQSMADGIIQAGTSASTPPPGRKGRLTRQQLLIQEARDFLESTRGHIRSAPSSSASASLSQPSSSSINWQLESIRNASTQADATDHAIIPPRRTRNSFK